MSTRTRVGCALLVAYPFVEFAVAYAIAQVIGWWWLLVVVVACVVLGLGLVRYALSSTGRSFGVALTTLRGPDGSEVIAIESQEPSRAYAPPAQTLLIVPAGLLIATPGILTTVAGLILWLPPVRGLLAARLERAARRMGPPGSPEYPQ